MKIGDWVLVKHNSTRDREYVAEARPNRALFNGCVGHIEEEHNGHGLCYDVRFLNGVACYEPEELEVHRLKPAEPLDRFCFE
jgi:hypothetical protein